MIFLVVSLVVVNYDLVYGTPPILIVPGLIASQLEAKVSGHGLLCDTFFSYDHYWLNLLKLPDCVNSVLSLEYDSDRNRYSNADGVDVRAPGFGETESIEHLDQNDLVALWHGFVEFFVEEKGYIRGKTIRAAPYDWRLAADELERSRFYVNFKNLVEEMYEENHGEKVTIVAHSMGGLVTLYFLNNLVTQNWKDKYIHAFIPLSGAWAGGNLILPILVSGLHSVLPGIPIVTPYLEKIAPAFQSFESTIWLLPNPSVWKDNVLVTTDASEYSANDYEELFNDMGNSENHIKHENVHLINGNFTAPNVPTYCFFGVSVNTPEVFHYGSGFPNTIEEISMGDGDGQVNRVSSEVCLRWSNQDAYFTSKEYPNLEHNAMLSDEELLNDIADVIGI